MTRSSNQRRALLTLLSFTNSRAAALSSPGHTRCLLRTTRSRWSCGTTGSILKKAPHSTSTPPSRAVCTPRFMTTAYDGEPGDGTTGLSRLKHIPYQTTLRNGVKVEVGPFEESDWQSGMDLMNLIIREGKSWPFDQEFETMDSYRGYFLSHTAFVVRSMEPTVDNNGNETPAAGTVLGCFYIKPNYPGRCSHICNGGFITSPQFRKWGVAQLMGHVFLQSAKDLGYKSAYFNLVFRSNTASVALWESLGFERVAVLENAANLEGVEGLDTAYGYRYDLETLPDDYLEQCE